MKMQAVNFSNFYPPFQIIVSHPDDPRTLESDLKMCQTGRNFCFGFYFELPGDEKERIGWE